MDNVEGWPWLPDKCPPDMYFIDYLRQWNRPAEGTILHMGTGLHHRVGIECTAMGYRVIGLTVSREEYISRVIRVDTPQYQVFYANINELDMKMLPPIDILTLFHWGEMESWFGPVQFDVLSRLLNEVNFGGFVFFYNRSAAWDRTKDIVGGAELAGLLKLTDTYESIEVYQKT